MRGVGRLAVVGGVVVKSEFAESRMMRAFGRHSDLEVADRT